MVGFALQKAAEFKAACLACDCVDAAFYKCHNVYA